MHPNRTRSQSANDRFWDRYIQAVEKLGVSEHAARWYVKRAEQYLKSLPDKRLAQHTPEDVDGYLRRLGRLDGIEDWQFRQAVDAIQTLFRVAGLATADRVDWGFWHASAQSLTDLPPRNWAPICLEAREIKGSRARAYSFCSHVICGFIDPYHCF